MVGSRFRRLVVVLHRHAHGGHGPERVSAPRGDRGVSVRSGPCTSSPVVATVNRAAAGPGGDGHRDWIVPQFDFGCGPGFAGASSRSFMMATSSLISQQRSVKHAAII